MSEHHYVYSLDGERYQGKDDKDGWETREEALEAGRARARQIAELKDVPPSPVWTGFQVGYGANAFYPGADALVEHMGDQAEGEVGGEVADEWPQGNIPTEALADLATFIVQTLHPFLDEWVEKHGLAPTFWSVADICKHADDDREIATT